MKFEFNLPSCIVSGNSSLEWLQFGIHAFVSHTNLKDFQSSVRNVCQYRVKVNLEHFRQASMVSSNILNCFKLDHIYFHLLVKIKGISVILGMYDFYDLWFISIFSLWDGFIWG